MKNIKIVVAFILFTTLFPNYALAQLNSNFYAKTCPNVLTTVNSVIKGAVAKDKRMGASLLRMHFHDCFVNGCDGSVLLDDNATFTGEKNAGPNANSLRGFEVIDTIKSQLETSCPGIVSCADILTVAARDSVVALGGPTWTVPLGRRDSTTASQSGANANIPSPASSLANLISAFQTQGLTAKDMITLSGAHTIGEAKCSLFRARLYNETNIDAAFATMRKAECPSTGRDNNLSKLDVTSATIFDNAYYKNLQKNKGLLHSDQVLFNGGSADSQVTTYGANQATFFSDFSAAMVKMGNINPLTGANGQVRKNCRKAN